MISQDRNMLLKVILSVNKQEFVVWRYIYIYAFSYTNDYSALFRFLAYLMTLFRFQNVIAMSEVGRLSRLLNRYEFGRRQSRLICRKNYHGVRESCNTWKIRFFYEGLLIVIRDYLPLHGPYQVENSSVSCLSSSTAGVWRKRQLRFAESLRILDFSSSEEIKKSSACKNKKCVWIHQKSHIRHEFHVSCALFCRGVRDRSVNSGTNVQILEC